MKVIQRNFRQFLKLRNWAWFGIIQKTRPLIGMINIEEEIKILESTADNAAKDFQKEVSEKKRLETENARLVEERALLLKRIEAEQGDMGKYQERQAKAAAQKADLEAQLLENQVSTLAPRLNNITKSPFTPGHQFWVTRDNHVK